MSYYLILLEKLLDRYQEIYLLLLAILAKDKNLVRRSSLPYESKLIIYEDYN